MVKLRSAWQLIQASHAEPCHALCSEARHVGSVNRVSKLFFNPTISHVAFWFTRASEQKRRVQMKQHSYDGSKRGGVAQVMDGPMPSTLAKKSKACRQRFMFLREKEVNMEVSNQRGHTGSSIVSKRAVQCQNNLVSTRSCVVMSQERKVFLFSGISRASRWISRVELLWMEGYRSTRPVGTHGVLGVEKRLGA